MTEMMLPLGPPAIAERPEKKASKFEPPEPSVSWVGSVRPEPWASEPHSATPLRIASSAPRAPGKSGSGIWFALAKGPVKPFRKRKSRCERSRTSPKTSNARVCAGASR